MAVQDLVIPVRIRVGNGAEILIAQLHSGAREEAGAYRTALARALRETADRLERVEEAA